MDSTTDEFKITEDLFRRNVDLISEVEERMSAGFTAKHEKHPDWQKNMECASYMEAADMAMQHNRPAEAAKLMGTGAICFGALFRSSKLSQAKDCVKKHGDGAEPCMDVLSSVMEDVHQIRQKMAVENVPQRIREVEIGLDKAAARLAEKGVSQQEYDIGGAAYVLSNYCSDSMKSLITCANKNGKNTTKCRPESTKLLECFFDFELKRAEAMMFPSNK